GLGRLVPRVAGMPLGLGCLVDRRGHAGFGAVGIGWLVQPGHPCLDRRDAHLEVGELLTVERHLEGVFLSVSFNSVIPTLRRLPAGVLQVGGPVLAEQLGAYGLRCLDIRGQLPTVASGPDDDPGYALYRDRRCGDHRLLLLTAGSEPR